MKEKQDIFIIGGGVIGVCSAYYLAKQGFEVTLVEKGEIAAGSSYGNAGLVVPSESFPLAAPGVLSLGLKWMLDPESPFYIKPRFDPEFMRWLWRFRSYCKEEPLRKAIPLFRDMQRASLELYHELMREEDIECHFEQRGLLVLFTSKREFEEKLHHLHLLQEYGLKAELLDTSRVREMVPMVSPNIVGVIHQLEDAHLDPALFVRGLADRAAALGVTILTNTEVLGLEKTGKQITSVNTTRGDYHPQQVVLAAGSWSSQLARDLRLKLPLQPAKGYSVTIKRPAEFPNIPLYLGDSRVVATPMGPHLRFAGTMELAGFDFSINQRRVKAILRAADQYLVGLEEKEVVEIWRGMRPCPPDGLPYIGRTRSIENLIVATGHSYLGLSMGPITGKLVTQIMCGEMPQIDLSAMQVDRFGR